MITERSFDSFSDDVIVRTKQREDGYWDAVLNLPPHINPLVRPDFWTCAKTEEEARLKCAEKVRRDYQRTEARRRSIWTRDGWYLKKHWMDAASKSSP